MTRRYDSLGRVADSASEAYLPYIAMRDKLIEQDKVPRRYVFDIVSSLRKGVMPDQGAVVKLDERTLGGFDLMAVEFITEGEAVVAPTTKNAVDDNTDQLKGTGAIVLNSDDGRMIIPSIVTEYNGFNYGRSAYRIGSLVINELGLSAPKYEIVHEDCGLLRAVSRKVL